MSKEHIFKIKTTWTGNNGVGTADYKSYERHHTISIENKPDLLCSADPAFRGDGTKHNPEDFMVASLSACHMMWYFHLCADAGIIVTDYTDEATGTLFVGDAGKGKFTEVTLNPVVRVKDASMIEKANELHKKASEMCFIANSCNFPVRHNPVCSAV